MRPGWEVKIAGGDQTDAKNVRSEMQALISRFSIDAGAVCNQWCVCEGLAAITSEQEGRQGRPGDGCVQIKQEKGWVYAMTSRQGTTR